MKARFGTLPMSTLRYDAQKDGDHLYVTFRAHSLFQFTPKYSVEFKRDHGVRYGEDYLWIYGWQGVRLIFKYVNRPADLDLWEYYYGVSGRRKFCAQNKAMKEYGIRFKRERISICS